ncbi:MAG: hypothetical protein B7Z02_14920 [Rhodobacterales bacterium 32-67-9]|nr:MAG: hypothetical protein B7Z02_14920 [Rhodobacterales bacterium 32-67-9]
MADSLLGGIVINEILIDPNSTTANYDTDGDGTAGAADEFVELYNSATTAIDISGLELWDQTAGNWFTFPSGTILQPGAHAVVITDALGGTGPVVGPDDYVFDADHYGALINNTGDAVVVYDPMNDEYIQATFNGYPGGTFIDDGGQFSTSATLVGSGENFGTDVDGYSIQRVGDGGSTFTSNQTPTAGTANVCFCDRTLIDTDLGPRRVEDLAIGDRIATRTSGYQTILWIGRSYRSVDEMARNPRLRPIRFAQGALGPGLPKRNLCVSRQHRLLVQGRIVERMTGVEAVLVPAIHFVELPGVDAIVPQRRIGFFHIVTNRHEVAFAEGVAAETMYLGRGALSVLAPDARAELSRRLSKPLAAFADPVPALPFVQGVKAREIMRRHRKNRRAIQAAGGIFAPI